MATCFFNTAGPIKPASHYCIPPLQRLDPQALPALIRQEKYFVLHAPRQTGKTSAPLALRDLLNSGAEGGHRCLHANVEGARAMRENLEPAMRAVLGELASRARAVLKDEFSDGAWPGVPAKCGPGAALGGAATPPAGFPATHRQRRRPHRTGIRPGPRPHGPSGSVAANPWRGADSGHLVIFDREPSKSWREKVFHQAEFAAGAEIHVWGM